MHPFTHPWLSLLARLHRAPRAHDPPRRLSLRARMLPPTGSRPLHQAHAPCSRRDHPRLITAHSLTAPFTSPPFRPGLAPAPSDGPDSTVTPPIRSGPRAHRTRTGPGYFPGSACCPARPRAMGHRGFGQHHHLGAIPTRKAIVDVLCPAPSRCRHVHGPRVWRAPTSRTASPSPPSAHRLHPRLVANLAPRGQPNVESQRRWGGSTPTTPLLSVRGCKWGSTPLSSISHQILE